MQVAIQPVTIYPNQATFLKVQGVRINDLGNSGSASIICTFLNDSGKSLSSTVVDMPGSVYDTWGTDDAIVVDYALQALGLTRA